MGEKMIRFSSRTKPNHPAVAHLEAATAKLCLLGLLLLATLR